MKYSDLRNKEKSIIMKNNYRYWKLDALDESGYFVLYGILIKKFRNILENQKELFEDG